MQQSLKKRYAAKLFANIIGLGFGLVIAVIVPRGLGPKAYGDFSFLSASFLSLMGFFTFSTSTGFFVKLSQRQSEFGLISFYGQFNLLAIIVLFIFVFGSHLFGFSSLLWIDQIANIIYLAALFGAVNWLVQIMTQIVDAYGLTVSSEIARIVQKLIGLLILIFIFLNKQLTLTNYLLYNIGISIFLIWAFIWIINKNSYSFFQSWKLSKDQIKYYCKEFYHYSNPLFFFSLFILIFGLFDRWILQKFGGSLQQGFFGLSNQIAAVCFLFSSAMTPLITRELSISFKKNDIPEMARLFRRYIPLLYSITAFIACFTSVQAEKTTLIFGGNQYKEAVIPVMIMTLYPIHQTYGQLSASVFFATGKTKLYSNISLLFIIIGFPVIYILLAPKSDFGFNLGATGLALKLVIVQFIGVNVQLFYNANFLKFRFLNYFLHQIISVTFFIAISFIAKLFIDRILFMKDHILINFITSGLLYSIIVSISCFYFPMIFGLKKDDIKIGLKEAKMYIKRQF